MKKIFVLSLLILAFAATAYSQPKLDFRASGFISVTTQMWQFNTTTNIQNSVGFVQVIPTRLQPGGAEFNRTASYVEQRFRLKFDAIMGKELSGTIFLEGDSRTWGDDPSGGAGLGSGRNQIGFLTADRSGVEVKNVYIDAAVPYIPVPITVRAGIQPFGVRSPMFWYWDAAGVTAAAKIDPVTIIGMWAKALEGRLATSDDVDAYGLHVNAKVDSFTIGGYGVYFNAQQYPLNSSLNGTAYGTTPPSDAKMWWIGAYADGKIGPAMINFDAIYDKGDVKSRSGLPKVKYNGYAGYLKVNFPWEAFNFGVVGVYGSGADLRKTSNLGLPGQGVADPAFADAGAISSKVGSFAVPPSSETGMQESEVLFASYLSGGFNGWAYSNSGTSMTRGSVGGLWFAKLYGNYKVTPEFKVTLQGLYIGDTSKNGDTFGNSRDSLGLGLKNNSTIGWEIDLINEWQVYKNLTFNFGGGILFPGDALKFWDPVFLKNEKPDNPWTFITKLIYTF
ncbi:MAG TPA: hypothetical protein VLK23_00920 [Thermodesulfobacteriota bacterium]|nr:hypothetical protein [Thermodesulfobacteriota bacterium]